MDLKRTFYATYGKRLLDLALIIPGILLISPLLIVITPLVRRRLGRSALFRQQRPGIQAKPFTIYKFRTMTDARDGDDNLLPDAERLTRLGRLLRKTSMDELPELFNIIKGDMSIVGPRPLLMQYLDRYTPEQARRHEVRPGLTGWAQVNGRNALSWEEKFEMDVWYVDHWSLGLDLKIIGMTVLKVLKREGISAQGEATMPEFMGSDRRSEIGGRREKTEVGDQRSEVGDQRSEVGGKRQRSEIRGRRSEIRGRRERRSEGKDRGRGLEVGGRRSEVGGRKAEGGDRTSEVREPWLEEG